MSIVSKESKEKRQGPATAKPATEKPSRPPRKKRRLPVFAVLILGLALLVGLLPTIAAHTRLLAYCVRRAAMLDGTITFRAASIGWFSPASVSGIEIRDAQGETVLDADGLTCDRSLGKLLFHPSKLGTLRIEKPRLTAKLTRDGSNVQTLLAHWLTAPSSAPSKSIDLSLEVVDGEATIVDQPTQQTGHVSGLQLVLGFDAQHPGPPANMKLNANLNYSWDLVNRLLQPYCGESIQIFGAGASSIAYNGPLPPAQGEASATLRFGGASVYGFQLGPGELKAHLAHGVLSTEPLEVTCNQGTLTLQPELRMDRQPMEFRLSAGTLASQIQLDEAACRSGLRYVAPVLASVTQSQGQFSLELDGCRVPIGDLNHAEIAGRMIVHSATVSPGPLVGQLASLLSTSPSLVRIQPESVIQFRMTGGRIYHQGLALEFPDVTMRTYGSAGLDDSLKLMVETSVPLKWFPVNAVTDAIRAQKMQIPIGGTLQSPQLDLGELARVQTRVLGNLTRGVLQSGLGNMLNGLLHPQK